MDYKAKECAVCGSDKIKLISHKNDGENIFYTYHCEACGEVFSTESKFLKQQEKLKKQAEKEAVRQAAKQAKEAALKLASEEETEQANNAPLSATEIFKKNRKFVVEIQADFGLVSSRGTGIIIGDGYILSNAHVVFDKKSDRGVAYAADEILCKDASQNVYELDLIFADIKKDMVLLHSDELSVDGVTFCAKEVETGEKIYAIGNSKGQGICILDGIVSDSERIIGSDKFIMFSAPIVHGNSGGPVFNGCGEVICIATLGRADALAMNYAIPVSAVRDFIEKAKDKEEVEVALKIVSNSKI